MSDTNLEIKNSEYVKQNLVILANSNVENENLIIGNGENYVKRFSPEIMKTNDTMQSLYSVQRDEIETFNIEINSTIDNTFFQSLIYMGFKNGKKY